MCCCCCCMRGWCCSSLDGERCRPAAACVHSVSGALRYFRGCARNVFGEMSEKMGSAIVYPDKWGRGADMSGQCPQKNGGTNLRFVVGDALTPWLLVPEKTNVAILLSRVNFIFEKTQMLCVVDSQCTAMNEMVQNTSLRVRSSRVTLRVLLKASFI